MSAATHRLDLGSVRCGRASGSLTIAISERDCWNVPVVILEGAPGPTVLMTGAIHGDEYDGPVALTKLARSLEPDKIAGRIILVPVVNGSAISAQQRCSPLDGLDLNRCFPGHRFGKATERLAYAICTSLVPMADVVIDCHSGGTLRRYIPSAMMHPLANAKAHAETLDLIKAMMLPAGVVTDETIEPGMLQAYIESQKKIYVCCEFGGGGVSKQTIQIATQGLLNSLTHLGMIETTAIVPEWNGRKEARLFEVSDLTYGPAAEYPGLFEPLSELGDTIRIGQAIGLIHQDESSDPSPVVAPADGILLMLRGVGRIQVGSPAAQVAIPLRST